MKIPLLFLLFFTITLSASEVFHLPPGDPRSGPLGVEDFQLVTNEFITKVWVQHMKGENLDLVPQFDWNNPYLMAGSTVINGQFKIIFSGAYVRLPVMNRLGIAFVLCHELAHLKGGEPRIIADPFSRWASVEGQSDYWASSICLPEFLEKSSDIFKDVEVSPDAQKICKGQKQEQLCSQIIASGMTFFNATAPWIVAKQISLEEWDSTEVTEVNRSYPTPQCRLQTVIHGALKLDRPRCWFVD